MNRRTRHDAVQAGCADCGAYDRRSTKWQAVAWVVGACIVASSWSVALAQGACSAEFDAASARLATRSDGGDPSGSGVDPIVSPIVRVATTLARVAFEALEPAYPAYRRPATWSDPNAAWLDARGWLPSTWTEDRLDGQAWAATLERLTVPYGASAPGPVADGRTVDVDVIRDDVEAALAAGAAAVRPLAVVAETPGGQGDVAFTAVIWNWTPYPRLLLFGPRDVSVRGGQAGDPAASGLEPILATLGTCAWRPRAWVTGRADDVARFYVASSQTSVRIVATNAGPEDLTFTAEESRDAFDLSAPALADVRVAAAVFSGPGPGLARTIATVTSLRSNVGLFGFGRYLEIP